MHAAAEAFSYLHTWFDHPGVCWLNVSSSGRGPGDLGGAWVGGDDSPPTREPGASGCSPGLPCNGVPVPGLWGTGDKQSPCPQTQRCACEWSRQGWKSPEAELGAICLCTCGWWLPGSFLSNLITCQNETAGLSLVGPQNSFFWFYFFSLFFFKQTWIFSLY